MNLDSSTLLVDKIKNIVDIFNVKEKIKESIPDKHKILELVDKMITPDRCDNFIMPINQDLITNILQESFL